MGGITGIIAEYNPFHKGHGYQIEKVRELTGDRYVLVIMSGDFVQRGAPAIFDKYARTRMALLGGADAVLELPSCRACGSAEYFAKGSVEILDALGCAEHLCFPEKNFKGRTIFSCCKKESFNFLSGKPVLRKQPDRYSGNASSAGQPQQPPGN